jgi:hypothetical protein
VIGILTAYRTGQITVQLDSFDLDETLEDARSDAFAEYDHNGVRVIGLAVVELHKGDVHVHAMHDYEQMRAVSAFAEALETLLYDGDRSMWLRENGVAA